MKTYPAQRRKATWRIELKIWPAKWYYKALAEEQGGFEVWYGMREGESPDRAARYANKVNDELYEPHEVLKKYPQYLGAMGVRFRLAVLDWSEDEVKRFVGPENLNPLYAAGFDRVGCFPCEASGDAPRAKAYQFDVCVKAQAFKVGDGSELCTSRLKTEPFRAWLAANMPPGSCTVYYGFDPGETKRMQRRTGVMAAMGYRTDYPAALWPDRTILAIEEIGIARPSTYGVFKHGNCVGCLKAGWQHWYVVYCTREDVWLKAKWAEEEIGYAIHHDESGPVYLDDMEERFATMKAAGVPYTERVQPQTWWAQARKTVRIHEAAAASLPCDCAHAG